MDLINSVENSCVLGIQYLVMVVATTACDTIGLRMGGTIWLFSYSSIICSRSSIGRGRGGWGALG